MLLLDLGSHLNMLMYEMRILALQLPKSLFSSKKTTVEIVRWTPSCYFSSIYKYIIMQLLFKAPGRNPENIKIQGHLPHQMDISWEVRERAYWSIRLYTRKHYGMWSVHSPVVAAVAHWTQWPGPWVQGELQEAGCGRCLEGAPGQKTLLCREEHVHFCPLRDQSSEQEQPRPGTRS